MAWAGTLVDFRDGISWTGAANSNVTPAFTLLGGKYALTIVSSGTPSVTLSQKQPGGSFLAVSSAVATSSVLDLPPGTYELTFGASAGTAAGSLIRIPHRGP